MALLSFLYFSRKSSALENAIWLMYFSTSSAVIPIPASDNGEGFFLLIHINPDGQVTQFSFKFAHRSQCFQLLSGINCIGNQFPQEYLMVRVKEFLNDGENVLRGNIDFTFLHRSTILMFYI